jgi:hypothetical protein
VKSRSNLLPLLAAFILAFFFVYNSRPARAQVVVEPSVPILTAKELRSLGLQYFPDMPMGVIKDTNGSYLVFGAGAGANHIPPTGTYKFTGTLDHFVPDRKTANGPAPSLMLGRLQPSPDGSDFDRDYAGGGPVYRLDSGLLLHIYHGEYHYDSLAGMPAYGGLGMAISNNDGNTFDKIGQVISPHLTREELHDWVIKTGRRQTAQWADGAMVEADADGNPIDPSKRPPIDDIYYYVIVTDRNSMKEPEGLAIARVRKREAIKAIEHRFAPKFLKYYLPEGETVKPDRDYFTEPGLGGRSTLILSFPDHIAQPMVLYDEYLRNFVLCYMEMQQKIMARWSSNLFRWSGPVLLYKTTGSTQRVFYPTIVGSNGTPGILDKTFYLYFVTRSEGTWNDPELKRETVTLTPEGR